VGLKYAYLRVNTKVPVSNERRFFLEGSEGAFIPEGSKEGSELG
jgi:hypothetical protein